MAATGSGLELSEAAVHARAVERGCVRCGFLAAAGCDWVDKRMAAGITKMIFTARE